MTQLKKREPRVWEHGGQPVNNNQIPDVLCAMVLAGFEVRLTFNALAIDMPYTCHTYKCAHGESEAPWSHGAHGNRLVEAVARSWETIQSNPDGGPS